MHDSKEKRIAHHKALLDDADDVKLFTNGGCGVFALALHLKFQYKIRRIPGYDPENISHIYCQLIDGKDLFAIDAIGTNPEFKRVKYFGSNAAPYITEQELRGLFQPADKKGLFGEAWFVDQAIERANKRIEKYFPYFDGSQKDCIPVL